MRLVLDQFLCSNRLIGYEHIKKYLQVSVKTVRYLRKMFILLFKRGLSIIVFSTSFKKFQRPKELRQCILYLISGITWVDSMVFAGEINEAWKFLWVLLWSKNCCGGWCMMQLPLECMGFVKLLHWLFPLEYV